MPVITDQAVERLLAGPPLDGAAEPYATHRARLGSVPTGRDAQYIIPMLEAAGLLGRGGAGFPVGRKWRTLAERRGGSAVVVANGAEGEVASAKDRVLMTHRPHLVLDGALLAAEAIRADELVLYIGGEHETAITAMRAALAERRTEVRLPVRFVLAPQRYTAGEESGACHFISTGDPRPVTTPPRVFEKGVDGKPTLLQNVESLAHVALIARFGDAWYRELGRDESPGTALITVSGAGRYGGVREIELGTPIGEIADAGRRDPSRDPGGGAWRVLRDVGARARSLGAPARSGRAPETGPHLRMRGRRVPPGHVVRRGCDGTDHGLPRG